eukprot:Pgem_evm1s17160
MIPSIGSQRGLVTDDGLPIATVLPHSFVNLVRLSRLSKNEDQSKPLYSFTRQVSHVKSSQNIIIIDHLKCPNQKSGF